MLLSQKTLVSLLYQETNMKVLNHLVLAFIFLVQMVSLQGCAQHIKVFECKLDCADKSTMECRTSVSGIELDMP